MTVESLDHFAAVGQSLLDGDDAVQTHSHFVRWVDEVREWLSQTYPNMGLSAEWAAVSTSPLVIGGQYHDDRNTWVYHNSAVQSRLRWLGNLPSKLSLQAMLTPARAQNEAKLAGRKEIKLQTVSRAYVDPDRINELKALPAGGFDLAKLIRMCEELNICFAGECYLAMIMHTRAIIDHVPPIFGCKSFSEVASNYGGTRSFKEAMATLDTTSRKIADHYLHAQIRKSEALPNATQIDFSNAIDLLLAEIGRVLK
jgi:hypothetical protein